MCERNLTNSGELDCMKLNCMSITNVYDISCYQIAKK